MMEPKIETKDKEIKKESFSGPASYPISSWVSGGEAGFIDGTFRRGQRTCSGPAPYPISSWVSGGVAGSGFQPRDLTLSSIQN